MRYSDHRFRAQNGDLTEKEIRIKKKSADQTPFRTRIEKDGRPSSLIRLDIPNFTKNVWGGSWIPAFKRVSARSASPIGESWELSGRPEYPSWVRTGGRRNATLVSLIRRSPEKMIGRRLQRRFGAGMPLLLKFIDAKNNLSLQVHPANGYARRHERSDGKDESWIVLGTGARRGDGYLYVGFDRRRRTVSKDRRVFRRAFRNAIEAAESIGPALSEKNRKRGRALILPFLNRLRVRAGDALDVPAGTVHAIGKGVRLFEIQQASGLTYRLWDWNRADRRPLHIKKAFDVLDMGSSVRTRRIRQNRSFRRVIRNRKGLYACDCLWLDKRGMSAVWPDSGDFSALTVIQGRAFVRGRDEKGLFVPRGQTVFVPAAVRGGEVRAAVPNTVVLRSYIP